MNEEKNLNLRLSREYLYRLIVDHFDIIEPYLKLKHNKEFIRSVFKDSATFVSYFEKDLNIEKEYSFDDFNRLIRNSLNNIVNEDFKELVEGQLLKETYDKFKAKRVVTYKEIAVSFLRNIASYHNTIIETNFKDIWFDGGKSNIGDDLPQTFLSYAYSDKGVTLGLFLYFMINGGFLYVNWMWSGVYPNCAITKHELNKVLHNSSQFLFLRTPNSELDYYGSSQIRQWCSWEIGNYYTKNKDNKFYLNFYGRVSKNDILSTFNIFCYVKDGIVNG